jgi:hypothetical protein
MTALPFLLHFWSVNFNEIISQSGSYEHVTIWLFESSAAKSKRHHRPKNNSRTYETPLFVCRFLGANIPINTL